MELSVAASDQAVPYGEQPDPQVREMIRAAALASEIYGDDELERWAEEARRQSTTKETNDVEER
jgi:hypothetical protein